MWGSNIVIFKIDLSRVNEISTNYCFLFHVYVGGGYRQMVSKNVSSFFGVFLLLFVPRNEVNSRQEVD